MTMSDKILLERLIRAYIESDYLVKALNYLQWGKPDEISIIGNLMRNREAWPYFADVMAGAHVEIVDQHARYHAWCKLRTRYPRPSSHPSVGTQYAVDGPFCHTILFGMRRNVTWMQLERHPYGGVKNTILHGLDWWKYGQTKRNQGPFGTSEYIDTRPVRIIPT